VTFKEREESFSECDQPAQNVLTLQVSSSGLSETWVQLKCGSSYVDGVTLGQNNTKDSRIITTGC
jgi:hypothetical protein